MTKTKLKINIVENNTFCFHQFEFLQSKLNFLIKKSEWNCYPRLSKNLSDPMTSPKPYWYILKTFLNNKKIPCILPLSRDDTFITNFKEKAEIFNNLFKIQYALMNTHSNLLPLVLSKKT